MASNCAAVGLPCGYMNRGVCGIDGVCQCADGYASEGDFNRDGECIVNVSLNKNLWAVNAALWILIIFGAVYALGKLERRSKEALVYEATILICTMAGGACMAIIGILEACASYPGEHSIGIDNVTTALFVVANSLMWVFLTLNPLSRSQTGIGSLALGRSKKWRLIYVRCVPVLILVCLASSLTALVPLYNPSASGPAAVSAYFALCAVVLLVNGFISFVTLFMMTKDFAKALSSSSAQEIPASQRATIAKIATSTRKLMFIPAFGILVFFPLLVSFSSGLLNQFAWATLPFAFWMGSLWMWRYIYRSIKASILVRDRDKDKTSHFYRQTGEVDTKNSSGNEGKPATANSQSSSGVSTSNSKSKKPRKTFKLKGLRSKPMQLMSQVTEGNSEGTVRFTQVDGMDTMNTSSSRYSRPITLSTKMDLEAPKSPRGDRIGHLSVSSVQSTLWEVDINGITEPPDAKNTSL